MPGFIFLSFRSVCSYPHLQLVSRGFRFSHSHLTSFTCQRPRLGSICWNKYLSFRPTHSIFTGNRTFAFIPRTSKILKLNCRCHCREAGKRFCSTSSKEAPRRAKVSEIKRLLSLAKTEKWKLTCAIALLVVSSSISMSVPFLMGKVIDLIFTGSTTDPEEMKNQLRKICAVLFGVFVVGGLANFGRVFLIHVSGQRITQSMRRNLFSSIVKQETAFFDKTRTGELVNRLSADTALVGRSLSESVSNGLRSSAQAVAGMSMMFYVSPQLACTMLFFIPPASVAGVACGRYLKNISKQLQASLAASTQVAEERISNMRTVRTFGQEHKEINLYSEKIEEVFQLGKKDALALGTFYGLAGLTGNLIVLGVFYNGGMMMSEAALTVGQLTSFLLYSAYVAISMGGLSTFYSDVMKGVGASHRLWELVDRKPEIPIAGGVSPEVLAFRGGISFENVSFSYPTRADVEIFKSLTLHVPAGVVTAVVGSSGSGKSTVASLLLRLYDPTQGQILVGEHDTKGLNPQWLRQNIGIVSQEPVLFSSTIRENIAYGRLDSSNVTSEEIISAAVQANAYDFIKSFPKGLETIVGERGQMLSGGQKQRVAIARAILKNPSILILDEATSALDAESEYLVQEALNRLMQKRTVIIIAHRLSTIRQADKIVVLDGGKVCESGTYDDLMENNGLFRKLVERQVDRNQEPHVDGQNLKVA